MNLLIALLVSLGSCFMIAPQSFWADEIGTYNMISSPSPGPVFHNLVADRSSDSEMPLFMILAWGWKGLVGMGETALRSFNMVWFGIIALCLLRIRKAGSTWLLIPWTLLHPFLWYYMSEFRPYLMLTAGGFLLLVSTLLLGQGEKGWLGWFTCASLVLVGANLLGVIALFSFLPVLYLHRDCARKSLRPSLVALNVFFFALFGGYYAFKLAQGAGGGKHWHVGVSNLVFSFYELLGFSGLGPGRSEMRSAALQGLRQVWVQALPHLVLLAALAFLYLFLLGLAWRERGRLGSPLVRANNYFMLLGVLSIGALAAAFKWPFWGRHLSYLLPFLLFNLAEALHRATSPKTRDLLTAGFLLLFLASDFNLRFNPAYGRDDCRGAVRAAQEEYLRGGTIWWVAPSTFDYYRIYDREGKPVAPNVTPHIRFIGNATADELRGYGRPTLVVVGKAEITDRTGAVSDFLRLNAYRESGGLVSFDLWRPSGS